MSLSCSCDADGADWYYEPAKDFSVLETKRGRKCCSCGAKIQPEEEVMKFRRWREPSDRCNYIEESIYGDEVPMAPWFMCETCGGLYLAVDDLGMCCDISENIAHQIKEYRAEEDAYMKRRAEFHARMMTPNAQHQRWRAAPSVACCCYAAHISNPPGRFRLRSACTYAPPLG